MATASTLDQLPVWARALVSEARVAHLGLIDDAGRPRVLPITFAVAERAVWSAIDHKPKRRPGAELARVRWLRARPQSTLTVDRYDDDWSRLGWVQLIGTVEVLEVADCPEALTALGERYPQYRERPPAGPLLRLDPGQSRCWSASAGS